ncbi:MAG: zinc ribbon domain-containing protein [Eubacterium sp.]|nr:zinc ribbon domain-containing protein [Eubacterium sp.]
MFCNNCGSQLPDGSKFCNVCGSAVGGAQQIQYGAQQIQYGVQQAQAGAQQNVQMNAGQPYQQGQP